ncbi:MAG: hypothetical protein ACRBN8_09505 [Nannocystales bacterium]
MAPKDRRTFSFRVELGSDALWEHLCAHEEVRASDDPAPGPSPPHGAPFLVARSGPDELRLRRWAGPADTPSPIVVVDLEDDERGCTVYGRIESGTPGSLVGTGPHWKRYILPGVALLVTLSIGGAILGGGWAAIALPLLLLLFGVPAGAVMLPLLMLWNQQSRATQTEALWGLIGEVFTPLALPEEEDPSPFR